MSSSSKGLLGETWMQLSPCAPLQGDLRRGRGCLPLPPTPLQTLVSPYLPPLGLISPARGLWISRGISQQRGEAQREGQSSFGLSREERGYLVLPRPARQVCSEPGSGVPGWSGALPGPAQGGEVGSWSLKAGGAGPG